MKWTTTVTIAMVLALLGVTADAHHGWSGYDEKQELNVTGTIKQSGYEHPHGHLNLEASGQTWHVTLAPPSRMENRGLPASALKSGTEATVVGYPSRREPNAMRAERITIAGKTVELR